MAPNGTRPYPATRGFERLRDNGSKSQGLASILVTQGGEYSASASANHGTGLQEPVEMTHVHIRTDMDVSENYVGSPV